MRLNSKTAKRLRRLARSWATQPDDPRYEDILTRPKLYPRPTLEDPQRMISLDIPRPYKLKEGTFRCIYKDFKQAHQ